MSARALPSRLVLIGDPVAHSLSPVFQNAALIAAGLPVSYSALRVPSEDLDAVITQLRVHSIAGNVTIPHKERFAGRCDSLSELASRAGAVNTFWFEDDALAGDNTDVAGAVAAIRHLCPSAGASTHCTLIGAGGSASALLLALESLGVTKVHIVARTAARAHALCERLGVQAAVLDVADDSLACSDIVINTTPVGLYDDELPFDVMLPPEGCCVLDLVYRPGGTALVRAAAARGLPAEDGTRMLIEQGAEAFSRWFGIEPDRAVMWSSLQSLSP